MIHYNQRTISGDMRSEHQRRSRPNGSKANTREAPRCRTKVAYMMSRFPKITETFILYEMMAVEEEEIEVEVYPLMREKSAVIHREAEGYVARAHFVSYISWPVLLAHLYFLARHPATYLGALWTLIRANMGSRRFLTGALGLFPKTVYFARHMQTTDITHVHAHFASHPAAAAWLVHQLTGIPYSFTAHGSDLHRERRMLVEKVADAAFVVPISSYNEGIILDECQGRYSDKLVVIHCGVDTAIFQAKQHQAKVVDDPLRILCIGTLHEVKGQTYLIQACQLLHKWGIDFVCNLVADGPDWDMLHAEVNSAELMNHIHFLGRRTRDEVVRFLGEADVLVAPSVPSSDGRREGIPMVLMEAMACGLPVISSRLSGIPELVEDGVSGFLTEPRDVNAIADGLARLAADPGLRHHMGLAGREKVATEFDIYTNARMLAGYFTLSRANIDQSDDGMPLEGSIQ